MLSVMQSPTQSSMFEYPSASAYTGRELWEAAAACHGPEDPPAALLRAADACREPLLVLVASCYEVCRDSFAAFAQWPKDFLFLGHAGRFPRGFSSAFAQYSMS